MTIADMVSVLHARVLCGEERLATPVYTACCSDLMSEDVYKRQLLGELPNERGALLAAATKMKT